MDTLPKRGHVRNDGSPNERDWLHRLVPYEILVRQAEHERDLAKRKKKTATLAARIAKDLQRLSVQVSDLDEANHDGPLDRMFNKLHRLLALEEDERRTQAAFVRAITGTAPAPGDSEPASRNNDEKPLKPQRGPFMGAVSGALAGLVSKLREEAQAHTSKRGRYLASKLGPKGGAPSKLAFGAGCRILTAEGHAEDVIAARLIAAGVARGTPTRVKERVRVYLNRHAAEMAQPAHPLGDRIEHLWRELLRLNAREKERAFVRQLVDRIPPPESLKDRSQTLLSGVRKKPPTPAQ